MTILVDTSMLLAFAFAKDVNHIVASRTMRVIAQERRIVVAPVLTELFYMTMVRINYARAIEVFIKTRSTFDRRDFSIFQPTHCTYLELLP
jgi:predicted nucleic acid-binding protein